ncbi:MAG: hypothetical protein MZU95_14535 [Desulfomicrobium escambiense]|nr:hypothetical protein [Desulfomicrobium escambiense]
MRCAPWRWPSEEERLLGMKEALKEGIAEGHPGRALRGPPRPTACPGR